MRIPSAFALLATVAVLVAGPAFGETADRIWTGGTILTMSDATMRAEAVAIKDGRILAVGAEDMVMAHHREGTEVIDLEGRAIVPGFVDSHGHVFMGGLQALSANMLAPPDGDDAATAGAANPALTRMLQALGTRGTHPADAHGGHEHGTHAATATCMSDGILNLTTAMLGERPGTTD